MDKYLQDYINSLLEEEEKRRLRKFVDEITPMVLSANKGVESAKPQTLYFENSYKQPSIYTSPNIPIIQKSPDRLLQDKVEPMLQNTVNNVKNTVQNGLDWGKDKFDVLLNQKTDFSKPMLKHEELTDKAIKALKPVFPASSDMYTDSMTDFSRAKQNPNAEVININDVDKKLKQKLKEFGTQPNERGVHYNNQSEVSKLFSNSPEVKELFKQNMNSIKNGSANMQGLDFRMKNSDVYKNTEKFDRFASIQHGVLTDLGVNDKGQGTGKLLDRLDYKWRDKDEVGLLNSVLNNHGYNMQEKGNLENYFSVIDILSDVDNKDDINDLLHKLMKYFKTN